MENGSKPIKMDKLPKEMLTVKLKMTRKKKMDLAIQVMNRMKKAKRKPRKTRKK